MRIGDIADFPKISELREEALSDIERCRSDEKTKRRINSTDKILQLDGKRDIYAFTRDLTTQLIEIAKTDVETSDRSVGCVGSPVLNDAAYEFHTMAPALDVELVRMQPLIEDSGQALL